MKRQTVVLCVLIALVALAALIDLWVAIPDRAPSSEPTRSSALERTPRLGRHRPRKADRLRTDSRERVSSTPPPLPSPGMPATSDGSRELTSGVVGSFSADELEPATLPTLEGLILSTVDLYAEDYRATTVAEARRYLDDDALGSDPAAKLVDVLGGLPTREDAERAWRSPRVRELFTALQARDLVLVELDYTPEAQRSSDFRRELEDLHRSRDAAMVELSEELDRSSGYRFWTLLFRLRQATP
jgi:hypothetical protein